MTQDALAPFEALSVNAIDPSRNAALVYIASLAPGSRRTVKESLNLVAGILGIPKPVEGEDGRCFLTPWHLIRYQHVSAIRSHLEGQFKPATANKIIAFVKGVVKECWRLELMSAADMQRAVDVKRIKGKTLPAGRMLQREELRDLFYACSDSTVKGLRDFAVLGLLYGCGLRRSELAKISLGDLSLDTGEVIIQGKGNKERIAYLQNRVCSAIKNWLAARGTSPGALFCPLTKGGNIIQGKSLTDQAIFDIVRSRAQQAGLKKMSPHDLRRTFVTTLLNEGKDLLVVQRLAGHSQVATTQIYDHRDSAALKEAANSLPIPFFLDRPNR